MLSQSVIAITSSARLLFERWKTLALLLAVYAALLTAVYVFVSTREATVGQLIVTLALFVVAPALFFLLQSITINYASGSTTRKLLSHCLRKHFVLQALPVREAEFFTRRVCITPRFVHQLDTSRRNYKITRHLHSHRILHTHLAIEPIKEKHCAPIAKLA